MPRSIRARPSSAWASRLCTSMFQYGENDRRMANDWRPEIHDSDGLSMWTRQRRVDLAAAGQSGAAALQRLRRRESARLRPAAARPQLRPLPGRRRVLRPPTEPVGRAEDPAGARARCSWSRFRPSTRPSTTSSPSGIRRQAAARPGAAVRLPPALGRACRLRRRSRRSWPRAPAWAAWSARSAIISRGASRSILPAVSSRAARQESKGGAGDQRLTRRGRDHFGAASARDQRLPRDVRSQAHGR